MESIGSPTLYDFTSQQFQQPYLVIGAVVGAQHASQMHFLWHSNRGLSDPSSRRLAMSARTSLASWNIGLRDDLTFFVRPGASPAVGPGAIHVDNLLTVSQHDLNFLDAADLLLGRNTGQLECSTYDQHGPQVNTADFVPNVRPAGEVEDDCGLGFTLEALCIVQHVASVGIVQPVASVGIDQHVVSDPRSQCIIGNPALTARDDAHSAPASVDYYSTLGELPDLFLPSARLVVAISNADRQAAEPAQEKEKKEEAEKKKLEAEKAEAKKKEEAEKKLEAEKAEAKKREEAEEKKIEAEKAEAKKREEAEKKKLEAEKVEADKKLEAEKTEAKKKEDAKKKKLEAEKAEAKKKEEAEKEKLDAEKAETKKRKLETLVTETKKDEEKAVSTKKTRPEKRATEVPQSSKEQTSRNSTRDGLTTLRRSRSPRSPRRSSESSILRQEFGERTSSNGARDDSVTSLGGQSARSPRRSPRRSPEVSISRREYEELMAMKRNLRGERH